MTPQSIDVSRWRRAAGGLVPWLSLMAIGCVTTVPRSRTPSPEAAFLEDLPARSFTVQECGAGSLSAVLNYLGDPVSQAELQGQLPKAANGGVLSLDLLLAARSRGFEAELIAGSFDRVASLLGERLPLIMMLRVLDAPGRGRDLYHYVVVDGQDRGHDLLRVQFGDGKARWVRTRSLERAWEGAGRALLVIRPAGAGGRATDLRAAVALERAGRLEAASTAYRALLEAQPESALLWTNLGNAEMKRGLGHEAEQAYRRALALDSENRDALNNLSWLLLEQRRLEEAERLARRAVELAGPDPHYALDTLGRILREVGSCEEAIEIYTRALELAPASAPERGELSTGLELAQRDCEARPGAAGPPRQSASQ